MVCYFCHPFWFSSFVFFFVCGYSVRSIFYWLSIEGENFRLSESLTGNSDEVDITPAQNQQQGSFATTTPMTNVRMPSEKREYGESGLGIDFV